MIWFICASGSTKSETDLRGMMDCTPLPLRPRVTVAIAGSTWSRSGKPAKRAPVSATDATARSSPPLMRYRAARSSSKLPVRCGSAAVHMARRSPSPGAGMVNSA
jgi:hypothetical protein